MGQWGEKDHGVAGGEVTHHLVKDCTANGAWIEKPGGEPVPLAGNCALGRSSSNTLVIADSKVSRHHATIHAQDAGEFWLIDLGSINGTLRNGQRVTQPVRLHDGDRITIAETTFVFHQTETAGGEGTGTTSATVPSVLEEQRWLLLADIEGFTLLSQRLPAEELAKLVGQWIGAGRETVRRSGGRVVKYTGDGYLACWPESAESAAQVVTAMQEFRAQRARGGPAFRVIVHHGRVAIGGAAGLGEELLMGSDVNFVFRAEKVAAEAGAAFCFSAAACARLGGGLALEPVPGSHLLKGFPGTYEFFQLRQLQSSEA